jgi:hypothetical protein
MVGVGGLFKGFCVAAETLSRKPETIELTDCSNFVAGVAVHYRVRADQGKTILVLVDVMDGYLPTVGVVAQFTFGAIFASMQIGMAVLALVGGVGELQIGMAVTTRDSSVTPTKRKPGARMIKFDFVLDHFPVRGRVAGCAG